MRRFKSRVVFVTMPKRRKSVELMLPPKAHPDSEHFHVVSLLLCTWKLESVL